MSEAKRDRNNLRAASMARNAIEISFRWASTNQIIDPLRYTMLSPAEIASLRSHPALRDGP